MSAIFKCIKDTTFKGRLVRPGDTVTVRDSLVESLTGHPCWEQVGGQSEAPAEKPKVRAPKPKAEEPKAEEPTAPAWATPSAQTSALG